MKSAALVGREACGGCGGESPPFHVWRNGDGTAGVVDRPVVRSRLPWAPFAFGVTDTGGVDGAGVFPFGVGIGEWIPSCGG